MVEIVINPGTGPVENTSEEHARDNMKHFITDCDIPKLMVIRAPELDWGYIDEGRYAFLVFKRYTTRCHLVHMPGIPLNKVRYMGDEGQNIWDYPRLYVDESSWVWKFALLNDNSFKDPEDDEE